MQRRKLRPGGFTLVDILLAILMMTVGFVGLQMVQMVGFRANALARELAEASMLARAKTEQLKAYFALPANVPGGAAVLQAAEEVDALGCLVTVLSGNAATQQNPRFCPSPAGTNRFTRRWVADSAGQIFVQVWWTSTDGTVHYVELYDGR